MINNKLTASDLKEFSLKEVLSTWTNQDKSDEILELFKDR